MDENSVHTVTDHLKSSLWIPNNKVILLHIHIHDSLKVIKTKRCTTSCDVKNKNKTKQKTFCCALRQKLCHMDTKFCLYWHTFLKLRKEILVCCQFCHGIWTFSILQIQARGLLHLTPMNPWPY